jgi:hypothetical protein
MDTILRHIRAMSYAALGVSHFLLTVWGYPEVAWGIDIAFRLLVKARDL